MRLGEWVAEHGIDSSEPEWQAARELLLRRAAALDQAASVAEHEGIGLEARHGHWRRCSTERRSPSRGRPARARRTPARG